MTGQRCMKSRNGGKPDQRRLAVRSGFLSLAVITSLSLLLLNVAHLPAWAAHQGPVFVVDATAPPREDTDGDHHFKTLRAALRAPSLEPYGTILVEPGRYEGGFEIAVEGLIVRSTGGAGPTVIQGTVRLAAPDVRLEGLTIEGDGTSTVVEITGSGVVFKDNRVAKGDLGMLIEGTHGVVLEGNTIYDHAGDGLVVRDAWDIRLQENELRGNGGLGALVERVRDLVVERNAIAFNGPGGLWLKETERGQLGENAVRDNGLIGIALESSSEIQLKDNTLLSNEAGVLLLGASSNTVTGNEIRHQRSVGLILKNGSQDNVIEKNTIQGTQGRGATGIRLSGAVRSNRFLENRVSESAVGLVLIANGSGAPSNNVFERNEIARSDGAGVRLEPGAERNRFSANEIYDNLEAGMTSGGNANIYEKNEIFGNGTVGLAFQHADDPQLIGNRIFDNGAEGVLLTETSAAFLSGNEITQNVRDGIRVEGGRNARLLQNAIADNGGSGFFARGSEALALVRNRVRDNRGFGLAASGTRGLYLEHNTVRANGSGGIRLEGVRQADLDSNQVIGNLHYGLLVLGSEGISARRNFWGDKSGPAGAFAGSGNAVLGLPLDQVTPWLPAEPDELVLSSVSVLVIDSPVGQRIEFDASDRLGLMLELFNLGRGKPGHAELVSQGIVVAARYSKPPEETPPLGKEVAFYAIVIDGVDAGTAELTLFYREEDQPAGLDPERLGIFVLENGRWQSLAGRADPELKRVTGEIDISHLDGRLIALGMRGQAEPKLDLRLPLGWWGTLRIHIAPGWLWAMLSVALGALLIAYGRARRAQKSRLREALVRLCKTSPFGFRGNQP